MKVGLALGGGGAKGFAHIGVLKVLREAGIPVSVVAGTSIGSLVGAVFCAGSMDQLEARARSLRLTDIPLLLSPTMSAKGFFSGKQAVRLLDDLLPTDRIEDLPKPYAAVAADLCTSSRVVFTSGSIREAVRASISIPVLLTPVVHATQVLVDGGILDPLPVETARALGADVVIAVDLFGYEPTTADEVAEEKARAKDIWPTGLVSAMSHLASLSVKFPFPSLLRPRGSGPPRHSIDILEQTLAVSQRELTRLRLVDQQPEVLLTPPLSHVGLLDFHRGSPTIDIGVQCAEEALPKIKQALSMI